MDIKDNKFPPGLFLIGTQKGGTTSLASMLGQHSEICLADPKEPHFYTQNWSRGFDWYKSKFSQLDSKYLLDASTSYSAAPLSGIPDENNLENSQMLGVPERIFNETPDAKFIYLLRDPVKRTYSSYWHNVRGGYEDRSFREAIDKDSYYFRMGHYYEQLQLYLKYFSKESFLILLFEDFIKSPSITANECFRFLGLEEVADFTSTSSKNKSFSYTPFLSGINRMLSPIGGLNQVVKTIKPVIPGTLLNYASNILTKKIPPLEEEDICYLAKYFKEKNNMLAKEMGISLEKWTRV